MHKAGSNGRHAVSQSLPQHISFLSLSLSPTSAPAASYNIQPIATSAFSLPVSTIISDLTISEFILWTTNLRKHTNFIQLQILK
jgi:hypothetical protein